jgi:hypothetical protein
MFFRSPSEPVPPLLRLPGVSSGADVSRARFRLPVSGFRLDVVAGADGVIRLEVRDSGGALLAELAEGSDPLDVLGGGWRCSGGDTGTWSVAVGVVVPDLTYLTFLTGRRARASSRLSLAPVRLGPFWYVESGIHATRVSAVVAGRSTGIQKLRFRRGSVPGAPVRPPTSEKTDER